MSVVLSAGAGCGKTSVLTERFLSHLQPGPDSADLTSLVAITFTERAAREMRERIREKCLECLRTAPADQAEHWLAIVREMDSARISTIHSFCASLLRSHAVEAGLDPNFGLLDETLGASFLQQSVRAGLHERLVADDPDVAELVFEFGLSRAQELLALLVQERYRIDFAEWEVLTARDLAQRWDSRWHTVVVPRLLRDLAESEPARRTMELLGEQTCANAVMQTRCQSLLDEIPRLEKTDDPEGLLDSLRENARVQGGGTKKDWQNEDVYADVKEALAALRTLIDKLL
ncbi:MAG: UvrD-helicase domain-containing protein, partial [Deltaproteobacteria bacterium]